MVGVRWIQFSSFAIDGLGFFVVFLVVQQDTQVGIDIGVRWIQFNGFAIGRFGFLGVFQVI